MKKARRFFWLPQKRGQHGRDPKLAVFAVIAALALLVLALWIGAQV
ncbi:MAG: hypothetical protein HKO04_09065 [Silicimonas sp.]|nr:hypothetical protein [Silicimonas sp.]